MILLLIFSVLLAVLAGLFALKNTLPVTVVFLTWQFTGSLAIVLMTVFGLGLLTATLAILPALLASKWKARALRRRVRELEAASPAGAPDAETFPPAAEPPLPKDDPTLPL